VKVEKRQAAFADTGRERCMNGKLPTRFVLIFLLFLLSTIAYLDRTNISIAGVRIGAVYHLDNIHLGWIFSAFLLGYAAFQIPAGWLALKLGPRLLLALGLTWWSVFSVLTASIPVNAANAVLLLFMVRIGLGAGESVMYPAGNQLIARWIPLQERGKANGWVFAGVGAGAGITPPIITALMIHYSWQAAFWFCAAIGLVGAVVWYVLVRDRPEEHPSVSAAELAYIRSGLAVDLQKVRPPVPWRRIFTSRNVWCITLSYFAFGYVLWIFLSWFFIYLTQARGLNLASSALYTVLPFLAMTVGCLLGGVVNDRLIRKHPLFWGRCGLGIVSALLTALFLVVGSHAENATIASIVLASGAGALYLSQSSFWSATTDFAGIHTGVVSGVMNMGCQIGGALTASLTPWIAAHFGWNAAFLAAAILSVIGAMSWFFVDPNKPLTQ
jgi:ACS family glucarate transporter-like MFS transporter